MTTDRSGPCADNSEGEPCANRYNRRMMELDGIFLDFYGTVAAGDRAAVVAICERVVADHGLALNPEELAVAWGHHYFEAIETCVGERFRLLVEIERATLIETLGKHACRIDPDPYISMFNDYLTRPSLYDEVREVLGALDRPVCIVSNADERELLLAVEHLGLTFDYMITSENARSYKPDAVIFEAALRLTGWRAERVVHVGDSLHSDVGGAQRLGLRTAWVNRAVRMTDIGREKPDWTWTDLRPLLALARV